MGVDQPHLLYFMVVRCDDMRERTYMIFYETHTNDGQQFIVDLCGSRIHLEA